MVVTCLDGLYNYFISCDCIVIVHYPIQYINNCWIRLLSSYNIKYICTIYTRLDTCLMSTSRFSLRDKATLRLLKLHFYGANVVEWSRAQCINGVSSNPVEWRTQIWQLKNLILTLFGLIFRRIYMKQKWLLARKLILYN